MLFRSPDFSPVRFFLPGVVILALAAGVHAAPPTQPLRAGDLLPSMRGSFLTGKDVTLPAVSSGKTAVLILGFTYGSRKSVEPWGDWCKKVMAGRPDLTFFEMPMIGGMGKLGRWFIDRGMRKSTPAELHEHVITVYSDVGDWKRRLGVSGANEDDAFLVVVDGKGIVQWLHHGAFDAETGRTLEGVLAGHGSASAP